MFEKSRGEDVSVQCGGVAQLVDPHIVDDVEDEGGGAADTIVVEGLILDVDFPDSL